MNLLVFVSFHSIYWVPTLPRWLCRDDLKAYMRWIDHLTMTYLIIWTQFHFYFERKRTPFFFPQLSSPFGCREGSPRVEGDDDEEDIDDIEHEFNIDDERNNHSHMAEAMLHGKMSYGRGPDDDENSQFPPVIAGRTQPVSVQNFGKNSPSL